MAKRVTFLAIISSAKAPGKKKEAPSAEKKNVPGWSLDQEEAYPP